MEQGYVCLVRMFVLFMSSDTHISYLFTHIRIKILQMRLKSTKQGRVHKRRKRLPLLILESKI